MRLYRITMLASCITSMCFAQRVGFHDFSKTSWQVPQDHVAKPKSADCPIVNTTISDGAIVPIHKQEKENVQLSIFEIMPTQLQIGSEFQATVRFTNFGKTTVRVPWETEGERVTRLSADGKEERYEVVDISLRLGTGSKRGSPVFLKGTSALFASSELSSSYLELPPAGWADIKIKGRVECGHSGVLCNNFEPDDKGKLSAWWYQRVMTHRVDGCKEDYANYVIRELDSTPLPVVLRSSSEK